MTKEGMSLSGIEGGSYRPLSEESAERIHETAMRVFEEVGIEVNSDKALDLFRNTDARVDEQNRRVRVPRDMVMSLVSKAPPQVILHGRVKKHDLTLGGSRVYAGTGGTALNVLDRKDGHKRVATLDDLKEIARLVDNLENVHLFMLPTYPTDVPVEKVDVNRFFAGLDNCRKHVMGGVYTLEGAKQVIRMAQTITGSARKLRERPIISIITCTISPFKIDQLYGDILVTVARTGVPVVCPAEPLSGSTAPVTLAGTLTVQVVDSLAGVLISQLANPGTPVIFGSVASSTDLRDLKYITGSVETGLLNAAGAQMAQFYKLPFYATGGMTDSNIIDAQSGYESSITNLLCALAGANFIHDAAGLMEFALTMSYEKLVIDNEILGIIMRAVKGIEVNDETLAFDVMKKVGPGGHFVSSKHTRSHMRQEHYIPTLSSREFRERWEEQGSKDTFMRAREQVKEILAKPGRRLPPGVRNTILTRFPEIVG
ncbi:MAG: trimethylamine methyltransferase family protein [Chloroflexota bacterium]|nr:trimethylamine methyltransferase family protein [Chloroflexota bacterium]